MPRLDGAEATRRIVAEAPEINVVVLTSFSDDDHVLRAIDAGARGYILKDASAHDVIRALRAAAAGGAPLDPRVASVVVSRTMTDDPRRSLSGRECEILSLVADGVPPKAVARRLGISHQTVRTHLSCPVDIGRQPRRRRQQWRRRGNGTRTEGSSPGSARRTVLRSIPNRRASSSIDTPPHEVLAPQLGPPLHVEHPFLPASNR